MITYAYCSSIFIIFIILSVSIVLNFNFQLVTDREMFVLFLNLII